MAKRPDSAEEKLKALANIFNDDGVPSDCTDWEEEFICELVDNLIIAEEAGSDFVIQSDFVREKIEQIYEKFEDFI